MFNTGGRKPLRTAGGIVAVAALVAALFAGATRTAGAMHAIGQSTGPATVSVGVDGHLAHMARPPHRPHPLAVARDSIPVDVGVTGGLLALLMILAVTLPPGTGRCGMSAPRRVAGRAPPTLVA